MTFDSRVSLRDDPVQQLACGDVLFEAGGMGTVWQLTAGALRLDRATVDGQRFMQIVLPGDLIGLELLAAYPYANTARAIVPSEARRRVLASDAERRLVLMEGLLQQQRRGEDLVALRSSSAQDRLKALLLMLAPEDDAPWMGEEAHTPLPTIKDMAAIIDTSPETVSRIFANLKRTQILDGRERQSARFSRARLRESEWPAGMTRSDGGARVRDHLGA